MDRGRGWADRQLPVGDEIFLDHAGYFVGDLDRAGARLARLGFQVSPVNLQTNADATGALVPSGTSNRLVRLRRGFIEVLAATHDTPLAGQLKRALARYEGLHLAALSHPDMAAQRQRLLAAGFAMHEVVNLRRRVSTRDGREDEVWWSVLRPMDGVIAEGRVQFVTSHTPHLSWPEGSTIHANAADGLGDLLICVADRHGAADRYGRYVDRPPAHGSTVSVVALDRGRLLFVEPSAAAILPGSTPGTLPYMAGQSLRSSDMAVTAGLLAANGVVPLYADEELICIGPHDALGSHLLFHAPEVATPWTALAARR